MSDSAPPSPSLLIEILSTIMTLTPQVPQVIALGQTAIDLIKKGSVTPEEEAAIRSDLDIVKTQIDLTA